MKKSLPAVLFVLSLFCFNHANGQRDERTFSFGFGLEGAFPVGQKALKDYYGGGGGVTARASYHAGPGFITLTTGALVFIPKSFDADYPEVGVQIPVKLGYKYIFAEHLFVQAEAGYSSFGVGYTDEYDQTISEHYGGFTYAPTIGANFGVFELGLRYESILGIKVTGESSSLNSLGLRIGFNF
jgi:hypothetical protein